MQALMSLGQGAVRQPSERKNLDSIDMATLFFGGAGEAWAWTEIT